MSVDFVFKIVDLATANVFFFSEPYTIEDFEPNGLLFDIPSGSTPGGDGGEFQSDSTAATRVFGYSGKLLADSFDQLRDRVDALLAAHPHGGMVEFHQHDRYLLGRVSQPPQAPSENTEVWEWTASLRCLPWWYEVTEQSEDLSVGVTAVTPGGNVAALPRITFTIDDPGTVTLTIAGGHSYPLTIDADEAGEYEIDSDAGTVTRDGDDILSLVGGELPRLPSTGSGASVNVTLGLSGGATLTGTPVIEWRARWRGNV